MDVLTTQWGWIGGKMFGAAPPTPTPTPISIGGGPFPLRKRKKDDDDELLAIFAQHLARTRYEKDN